MLTADTHPGALLTAPMRARDRRLELLEDLVADLIMGGPIEFDDGGRPYCCRWCRHELPPAAWRLEHDQALRLLEHFPDCAYVRALSALKRTT